MRRVLALAVLLLLFAALVVPSVLLMTERGTRWLAAGVQDILPLELRGVTGTLLGGLEAEALAYHVDGLEIDARQLRIAVNLRCLLRSVICIRSLDVDELTLRRTERADAAASDKAPWEWLADLPSVEVGDAAVRQLTWLADGAAQVLEGLEFGGGSFGRLLDFDHLAACHARGCVDLAGGIDSVGSWRVRGALDLAEAPLVASDILLPRAYQFRAEGDTAAATVSLSTAGEAHGASLDGTLRYADPAQATASLQVSGIEALVPLLAEQTIYPLAGPLGLQLERRQNRPLPRIRLQQALRGPDAQALSLQAELDADVDGVQIEGLTLGPSGQPELRASGYVAFADEARSRLAIELDGWRLSDDLGVATARAGGSATLEFSLRNPLGTWALLASSLVLEEQGRRWEGSGQLRASGRDRFPLGAATLSLAIGDAGAGGAFRYERTAKSGPARITSAAPPQLGDLQMDAIGLDVQPATPLRFMLAVDGEVRTRVSGELMFERGAVRGRFEPFTVVVRDESFTLSDTVGVRWQSAARALALDPFCVSWRGSELCSEGGAVGADGELALRARFNESISGEFSDKPYAITARGQGRAQLAWQDWQPLAATVDADFEELTLDPLVGLETAIPVRWEEAALSGQLDAAGRGRLDARLSSQQFGELSVALQLRDGTLDGRLQSSALSLTAFRDLVPSWQIGSGTIEGDLRIDGTVQAPQLSGSMALRDGQLRIPALELRLEGLAMDARLAGRELALEGQALAGGGDLRVEARCCVDERIEGLLLGRRNRLQMENGLDAIVSPSLDFSLSPTALTSVGTLTVHSGVFEHSGLEAGGVALSPDVRRVDLAQESPQRFDLNLDLRALIQPGFTLRSKRIEATLAGDLRLLVPVNQPPSLFGNLEVLGGELRAYGQALRLTDGDLGFVGDPFNPDLAISAEREIRAENQRVGFRVSGSLEEPRFDLFSVPQRSDNETLSYLIRGRAPDIGVSADGTAMALSLGASALNQSGVLAPLNDLPGLSSIALGAEGTAEDMAATISAYVGNRLYISYGVGIYEPINALTARLYLRSRLWLEVVSRLESSFDLYYRFDIE